MNLAGFIYDSFTKEEKKREPKLSMTFSPSAFSACKRALYWKAKGEQPTNPPDNPSLFKMKIGDIIHDNIQTLLTEKGILESFEEAKKKVYNGLEFNYFYDGILNVDGKRYIMEIKTVYANGFRSIENEPKPEHVLQALCYMLFEEIDNAIILYIGRDNGYMLQYELRMMVTPEDTWLLVDNKKTDYYAKWLSKIEEFKRLKIQYLAGELPDRDFQMVFKNNGQIADEFQKDGVKYKSDWQCSYCSYKNKCWGSEMEEMKNHKFYINGKFS